MEKEASTAILENANTNWKREMKHLEQETIYYIISYLLQQLPLLLCIRGKPLEVLLLPFHCKGQDQRQTSYCLPQVRL